MSLTKRQNPNLWSDPAMVRVRPGEPEGAVCLFEVKSDCDSSHHQTIPKI